MKNRIMFCLSACVLTAILLPGCSILPFYTLPEETSLDYSFYEKDEYFWECPSHKENKHSLRDISSFGSLREAVGKLYLIKKGKPAGPCYKLPEANNDGNHIASFLHISDAHIRDERLFDEHWLSRKLIELFDVPVDTFHRDPFVDSFDSLTLASFLIAYGKTVEANSKYIKSSGLKPFVINGGDFLDISVVTEMMEMRKILKEVSDYYNDIKDVDIGMYSVAGNHDGLYFGNLTDKRTSTRGLGINKSEFILGNLLDDPNGYGFGNNEILKNMKNIQQIKGNLDSMVDDNKITGFMPPFNDPCHIKSLRKQCKHLSRAIIRIEKERRDPCNLEKKLKHPLTFRKLIKVPGDTEHTGLKLGYYSWHDPFRAEENASNFPNGIRYIVLDTRSNWNDEVLFHQLQSKGVIDLIQLGWLYCELEKALKRGECVVIFAHHSPFDMIPKYSVIPLLDIVPIERYTTKILKCMLDKFPNIIAYFYGHAHPGNIEWIKKTKFKFPLIQTGSLIDYPQVGRMVDIYLRKPNPEDCNDTGKIKKREKKQKQKLNTEELRMAEIHWKFVRPKGIKDGNVPNGFLLEAILENSLHLAEKDEKKQRKVVKKWEDEIEMSCKETVLLNFIDVNSLSKDEIFKDCIYGDKIRKTVNCVRKNILCLEKIIVEGANRTLALRAK